MRGSNSSVELTFIAGVPQCAAGAVQGCYTADDVRYYYMAIDSLYPTTGSVNGSTNVTLRGLNFGSCQARPPVRTVPRGPGRISELDASSMFMI